MQQAVEVANNVSSSLANSPRVDGILGLGFRNLNKGISMLTKKKWPNFDVAPICLTLVI